MNGEEKHSRREEHGLKLLKYEWRIEWCIGLHQANAANESEQESKYRTPTHGTRQKDRDRQSHEQRQHREYEYLDAMQSPGRQQRHKRLSHLETICESHQTARAGQDVCLASV